MRRHTIELTERELRIILGWRDARHGNTVARYGSALENAQLYVRLRNIGLEPAGVVSASKTPEPDAGPR
jgi:hypothetical protein